MRDNEYQLEKYDILERYCGVEGSREKVLGCETSKNVPRRGLVVTYDALFRREVSKVNSGLDPSFEDSFIANVYNETTSFVTLVACRRSLCIMIIL